MISFEQKKRNQNFLLKLIGIVSTVITALVGIQQFNEGQKQLKEIEFQKIYKGDSLNVVAEIRNKKQVVYLKIANCIGDLLAHEKIDTTLIKNFNNFKRLYYGEALSIEDSSVNKKMRKFKDVIEAYIDQEAQTNIEVFKAAGMELSDTLRSAMFKKINIYSSQ